MNERIDKLFSDAIELTIKDPRDLRGEDWDNECRKKFAELIVKEMCGMMEQAEDDAYHCFEPSERPTEYIEWLRDWQERVAKHFGVE